jgi:hypothetical protein
MKLSSYISKLQAALDSEGDLEVVEYQSENYGNSFFYKLDYAGGVLYFEDISAEEPIQVDVENLETVNKYDKGFCIN